MIENIIEELERKFPDNEWDLEIDENTQKYVIVTNDWDLYFKSKKFRGILKILRIKYKDTRFYCVFKFRLYE